MPFDRAKTSLQQIEEKLRRLFGLAGTIGAEFVPETKPVVLAGDLDGPGVASFRGRHVSCFSAALSPNAVASQVYAIATPVELIVYALHCSAMNLNSFCAAFLIEPEQAAAFAGIFVADRGCWIDQKRVTADPTPLQDTNGLVVSAGLTALCVNTRRIGTWGTANAVGGSERDLVFQGGGLHLAAGSIICWTTAAIQANAGFNVLALGLHGRIF